MLTIDLLSNLAAPSEIAADPEAAAVPFLVFRELTNALGQLTAYKCVARFATLLEAETFVKLATRIGLATERYPAAVECAQ